VVVSDDSFLAGVIFFIAFMVLQIIPLTGRSNRGALKIEKKKKLRQKEHLYMS